MCEARGNWPLIMNWESDSAPFSRSRYCIFISSVVMEHLLYPNSSSFYEPTLTQLKIIEFIGLGYFRLFSRIFCLHSYFLSFLIPCVLSCISYLYTCLLWYCLYTCFLWLSLHLSSLILSFHLSSIILSLHLSSVVLYTCIL